MDAEAPIISTRGGTSAILCDLALLLISVVLLKLTHNELVVYDMLDQ